ncbi:MAG: ABC transporter permease [Bacteroidota bacterium]|nr:ABC transporter permease [Bacteroidota bacterium]
MLSSTNNSISAVHLTSNIRQTIVAVLSVTFGISMYVFMNSFMTGVNKSQSDLAFSTLAHVRVYNDGPKDNTNLLSGHLSNNQLVNIRNAKLIQYTDGIKNTKGIIALLQHQPEATGVAAQVNINVFFRAGATKVNGILSGVEVENENRLFGTAKFVTQGNWGNLQYRTDGVIIGSGLAKNLSLKVNDNLNVLTGDGVSKNFKIIGIFETSIAGVDKTKAYLNIASARQLLLKNQDYVTDIMMNVKDYNLSSIVAKKLAPQIPYKVESWQMANGQLEAGSSLRDIIAKAVSLTILLVAGFGIYNIMNMTVNQKIREIAILKAMGFSGTDVTQIFLTQALVIGCVGGLAGMMLGYLVADAVNHIPFKIAGLSTLPMAYEQKDYVMAFVFGIITTFIAGYLPARKASKIDPVTIIRG